MALAFSRPRAQGRCDDTGRGIPENKKVGSAAAAAAVAAAAVVVVVVVIVVVVAYQNVREQSAVVPHLCA